MAISRVGSTHSTGQTNGLTSLVINKPTGVTTGDVLIAGVTSNDTAQGVPSGWTAFDGNTLAGETPAVLWQVRLYYKVAGGSEPSNYTWTVGSGGPSAGFVSAWRGCDTANPIDSTVDSIVDGTLGEPDTGPSATAISPLGRTYYVRAIRDNPADGVVGSFTTATAGVSRDATDGGITGTNATTYAISLFANDSNYGTTGSKSGLAISYSSSETQNYEATFNLRAPTEGSAAATIPSVTSAFVGDIPIVSGSIASSIAPAVANMDGIASPPSGSMSTTLSPVTSAFEGSGVGGSTEVTLSPVTSAFAGSVEPLGPISAQLAPVVASFGAETKPFGEHVIRVERDERSFLVTDDDDGLIRILRSQVTDA